MAVSERAALAGLAAFALTIAACDALIGLSQYQDVACQGPDACGDVSSADRFVPEAGTGPEETGADADAGSGGDARADADAMGDADADVYAVGAETGVPESGPTAHERWAYWPMPNPDAAIAPGSDAALPHAMAYDAGAEGGSDAGVYDVVTKLSWSGSSVAPTIDQAWAACSAMGWRVPTRIELVSLVDFTQAPPAPTIDVAAFPDTQAATYWTSSSVPGDDGPSGYWTVSFATGLAANTGGASYVRCVKGGAAQ